MNRKIVNAVKRPLGFWRRNGGVRASYGALPPQLTRSNRLDRRRFSPLKLQISILVDLFISDFKSKRMVSKI
jgi:hypothetical protein